MLCNERKHTKKQTDMFFKKCFINIAYDIYCTLITYVYTGHPILTFTSKYLGKNGVFEKMTRDQTFR